MVGGSQIKWKQLTKLVGRYGGTSAVIRTFEALFSALLQT